MSETNNEDQIVPASLELGESVVPELSEDSLALIDSIVEKSEPVLAEEPADENVITGVSSSTAPKEVKAMDVVENGVIGSTTRKATPKKAPAPKPVASSDETVAIHSSKSVTWAGVGKVNRGYNIVSKDAAEKWLSRWHCRQATPEEVAKEFGL